jgi:hypothetical protein
MLVQALILLNYLASPRRKEELLKPKQNSELEDMRKQVGCRAAQ